MEQDDLGRMRMALREAQKDRRDHKVGAVIVVNEAVVGSAYGGEIGEGNHAEYTLLERKLSAVDVTNGTLYTTLEPCVFSPHPSGPSVRSCADIIKNRRIKRVVIGMLDPNPTMRGRGEESLKKHGIKVDHFPPELRKQCETLNANWIQMQTAKTTYKELFSLLMGLRSSRISQYSGLGIDEALTLRICPRIMRGWSMSGVELRHETTKFSLPPEYRELYEGYRKEFLAKKGFKTDNVKIMLVRSPRSFTDAPYLTLHTKEALYSQTHFYKDEVAPDSAKADPLIQEVVQGETRVVNFAHALCLHLIVATNDNKVLVVKRAPDVDYSPNTWSCSIEEQLSPKDLEDDMAGAVLRWGKRALSEELGLSEEAYNADNLRVLSVFLESNLLNISLCGHVVLDISSSNLDQIIKGHPRPDYEFASPIFLEYTDDGLIPEILRPSFPYHPTSRYRMLMALMKENGWPRGGERFFSRSDRGTPG